MLTPCFLSGQSDLAEQGVHYFQNFTTGDYAAQPQNWAIVQDKHGLLYVANHGGVLQYDGISWRTINIPNSSVRSISCTKDNTIYIGGKNELGFLYPNKKGELLYVSLLPYLQEHQKKFAEVWNIHTNGNDTYFETAQFLFSWNRMNKKMKVWEPGYPIHNTFTCNNELFIHCRQVGLLHIKNDSLQLVPGGEILAAKKIFFMAPLDSTAQKILIGSRDNGFFLYDHHTITPFTTNAQSVLEGKKLYQGIRLQNGNFALATLLGGLLIMTPDGNIKQTMDKSSGLQDNNIKHVFQDKEGNLWLSLENGISKIEYKSPLSYFNELSGLTGPVFAVVRHQADLYVGTAIGLFRSTPTGHFVPVPPISDRCLALVSLPNHLLIATTTGVWISENNTNHPTPIKVPDLETKVFTLKTSLKNQNRVWLGTDKGLMSLFLTNPPDTGQWKLEQTFSTISQAIYSIVEEKNGRLWLGTLTEGLIGVEFPTGITYPVVTRYDVSQGLPYKDVYVFATLTHTMFATSKGLFRYQAEKQNFTPDHTLGDEFADGSRSIFRLAQDTNGQIWFHSEVHNYLATRQADNSFTIHATPFLRMPVEQVNAIYPDPNGHTIWFAAINGLIAYNTGFKKNYQEPFNALIREVRLSGENETIFAGTKPAEKVNSDTAPVFPYAQRNLRFRFAAPFFQKEKAMTFRVYLEGYDKTWSAWSTETQKDYTNLDGGHYVFHVQAKNIFDQVSQEDFYIFEVRSPWFKTWWAYILYGLVLLTGVLFWVRLRSWKLLQEKYRLEGIIETRTKEVLEKNHQLQEQSVQLKEMDRLKSRFFANISHEFRTPLTLIIGPLEQILTNPPTPAELENKAQLMLRHSQRLLHLVNQLLDLAHLESGKMKLQVSRQDMVAFLRLIVASFQSLAQQQQQHLELHTEKTELLVYFDSDKLEKVMGNLLSNAVKFTPAQGRITVSLRVGEKREANFPWGYFQIIVADTGIGIPAQQVEHVFQRFYQAHSSHEHRQKGTGIGLALTRELVLLHHGDIRVISHTAEEGQASGSQFILRLPLGAECWQSDELVEEANTDNRALLPPIPGLWQEAEAYIEPESQTVASKQEVILVVEDSADMRHYIRETLSDSYRVIEAVDGDMGLAKAREIIPDLIVCDIMMPGADGYDVCSQLKKDLLTSHIPIILLTAKSNEASVIEGLERGADDYITKPFNVRVLVARIKNLLELRRQLQQKRQRQMTMQPQEIAVTSLDETFYKEVQELIEKNLSNPEFNVEQMSKKLYMSRTSLYMKILALTGEPPTQFIRSYRLKRAAQLLQANFGNVTEVAFAVGFSSTAYFTKCFKEMFQQLPSSYPGGGTESP